MVVGMVSQELVAQDIRKTQYRDAVGGDGIWGITTVGEWARKLRSDKDSLGTRFDGNGGGGIETWRRVEV
jgi:hypothetical protein